MKTVKLPRLWQKPMRSHRAGAFQGRRGAPRGGGQERAGETRKQTGDSCEARPRSPQAAGRAEGGRGIQEKSKEMHAFLSTAVLS